MAKYVAICLAANNAAYDAELFARIGQNYDHHYEALSAWQADQATIGADVTVYGGLNVECYNDWPGVGLDDRVSIVDWITTEAIPITVGCPQGQGWDGIIDSGFFMHMSDNTFNGSAISLSNGIYGIIYNLQVTSNPAQNRTSFGLIIGDEGTAYRCIVIDIDDKIYIGIRADRHSYIIGCVVFGCHQASFGLQDYKYSYIYNCIAINSYKYGFEKGSGGSVTFYNCVSYGAAVTDWVVPNSVGSNNASGDYAGNPPPGTDPYPVNIVAADFEADGYHLSAQGIINLNVAGINKTGEIPGFTLDIDFDQRPPVDPWSIGADQAVGSSATPKPNPLFFGQDF